MSRVGLKTIVIPDSVIVNYSSGMVHIEGPKGSRDILLPNSLSLSINGPALNLTRSDENAQTRSSHGTIRALIASAIEGVEKGFTKKLEVNGVGFKVQLKERNLHLALGYSHELIYVIPEGVSLEIDGNQIILSGVSKQLVGQTAAGIRALRPPEPYKGKGIKYLEEVITHKTGKSAASEGSS